jgi:hypothetical protein
MLFGASAAEHLGVIGVQIISSLVPPSGISCIGSGGLSLTMSIDNLDAKPTGALIPGLVPVCGFGQDLVWGGVPNFLHI